MGKREQDKEQESQQQSEHLVSTKIKMIRGFYA